MKVANVSGRLHLVRDGRVLDVGKASESRFSPEPGEVYARWPELTAWAAEQRDDAFTDVLDAAELGAPVPAPRQVFALGTNYRTHAVEVGWPIPETPTRSPGPSRRWRSPGPGWTGRSNSSW